MLSKDINITTKIEKEKANEYSLKFFQKVYRSLKVIMDFFIALIGLIVLIPLFIIVAIAIKIDSKGPVFFKQKRIGKNNKDFTCIKFRSMSVQAKSDVGAGENEYAEIASYITRVGKFIRKTSIDELPQLFCLLTGKMSLIGYRPSLRSQETLNTNREKYNVYQVRPGITGWAQVNGRDILAAQPVKKAQYDAYYLEHYSLFLDIKIFFMTVVKVFTHSDVVEGVVQTATSDDSQVLVNK